MQNSNCLPTRRSPAAETYDAILAGIVRKPATSLMYEREKTGRRGTCDVIVSKRDERKGGEEKERGEKSRGERRTSTREIRSEKIVIGFTGSIFLVKSVNDYEITIDIRESRKNVY